ncbi:hypothetical protein [Neobacillus sp. D3-1R]|uniref:hypothetical protein n=1 Tax=Neobacillus sp. D3-1R TaxID=3445778 RepID=UPI003FA0F160
MKADELIEGIENLIKKVNFLEKSLEENNKPPINIQIDIKEIHLKELNLEELAFYLGKLDIKDLSGMLNLGNTISPNVQTKIKTGEQNSQDDSILNEKELNEIEEIQVKVNGKHMPFSIL